MKSLLALTVLFLIALSQACESPADSLSFCTNVSWQVDDALFTEIDNKGTYVELMDKALSKAYNSAKKQIEKLGEQYGFEFCEDCLNEFKNFLCAGAFPKCGIWPCLAQRLEGFLEKVLAKYGCSLDDTSCIQDKFQEIIKDLNNIPIDEFQQCYGEYMPSSSMCKGVIDICTCGGLVDSNIAENVCRFFASEGTTWEQSGSCTESKGWCGVEADAKKRDEDDEDEGQDGVFPINNEFKMKIGDPPVVAAAKVDVTNQETTLNIPDDNEFEFIPEDASTASVVTVFALLYVVVVALLF